MMHQKNLSSEAIQLYSYTALFDKQVCFAKPLVGIFRLVKKRCFCQEEMC